MYTKLNNLYWRLRYARNKSEKRKFYRYAAVEKKCLLEETGVDPEELRLYCRALSGRLNFLVNKSRTLKARKEFHPQIINKNSIVPKKLLYLSQLAPPHCPGLGSFPTMPKPVRQKAGVGTGAASQKCDAGNIPVYGKSPPSNRKLLALRPILSLCNISY